GRGGRRRRRPSRDRPADHGRPRSGRGGAPDRRRARGVKVDAKICGIRSAAARDAAAAGGAAFLGFVFYPRSPRAVTAAEAASLARHAPAGVRTVGVFVDPDDATLAATLETA